MTNQKTELIVGENIKPIGPNTLRTLTLTALVVIIGALVSAFVSVFIAEMVTGLIITQFQINPESTLTTWKDNIHILIQSDIKYEAIVLLFSLLLYQVLNKVITAIYNEIYAYTSYVYLKLKTYTGKYSLLSDEQHNLFLVKTSTLIKYLEEQEEEDTSARG